MKRFKNILFIAENLETGREAFDRAAQLALRTLDVSDLLHGYADLQAPSPTRSKRAATRLSSIS